jgi:hypothetical protein
MMIDANDYDNLLDLVEDAWGAIESFITKKLEAYEAEAYGLDDRAAYGKILTDKDRQFMVVSKRDDRVLQYYGGFEYVEKEYRHELGDYVIYMADDSRVEDHLRVLDGKPRYDEDEEFE